MNSDIHQGIGEAWLALAAELEQQLRESDPKARVEATLEPSGLLQLQVRTIPGQRKFATALARRYEKRRAARASAVAMWPPALRRSEQTGRLSRQVLTRA